MIDIHSHILPGLDDGSPDMKCTMEMLKKAETEGITTIIATPHYKEGRHNASPERIKRLTDDISKAASESGGCINIAYGNEVMYFGEISTAIYAGAIATINGSNRLLIEFRPDDRFNYIKAAVDNVLSLGLIPIIAHVERYDCMLGDICKASELMDMQAELQVNIPSIWGETGHKAKAYSRALLSEGLVTYIGTDAHDAKRRAPMAKKCINLLYKKYDKDYVDSVLWKNAQNNLHVEGR